MKKNITFDIDDCLVNTNGAAEKIAKKHGEALDYSDFHYINRCSPACAKEIYDFLFVGDSSCNPKLVEMTSNNIPEYMRLLSQLFNVHYVTARSPDKFEPTIKYFEHCNIPISQSNLITLGAGTDKLNVLLKLKTIFHLDDSATTIQKCLDNKINFCMMSNPQTGYNIYMRQIIGNRWVANMDDFWQRRFEFIPEMKQNPKFPLQKPFSSIENHHP